MRVSARADYAIRAAAELAAAAGREGRPVTGEQLAAAQGLSRKFLENIFVDLKRAGIVGSVRGAEGGYRLVRPAAEVSLADIIRAVDGPLANVRDVRPDELEYEGAARHLKEVWVAVRASLRQVLEAVTLADLVSGHLPRVVTERVADPDAWVPHLAQFGWVSPRVGSTAKRPRATASRR
jgi:Rrf2 family protein